MSIVTLITPTGARPKAFELCERYIERQTYQGIIQWIIVYDCDPPPTLTLKNSRIKQELHRGPKDWRQGINTQRPNLNEALKFVSGDYIFLPEDDDYYKPTFIEQYVKLLQDWTAVGEGNAKYYNIAERNYKEWANYKHASLCQTAIRKQHLDVLDEAVNSGELFIDCALWRRLFDKRTRPFLFAHQDYVIGMKGLPGRHGIGAGHSPKEHGFIADPGFDKLKEWIGREDAQFYIDLILGLNRR